MDAKPTAPDLAAMRALCESIYQPTEDRLRTVLAHDWSRYPRIAAIVDALPHPRTRDALSAAAVALLTRAAHDLESAFPAREDRVSPLEVFRWHVLEQISWLAIEAELREAGRPHSRGTLIRRQAEILPYILDWANDGASAPGAIDAAASPGVRAATDAGDGAEPMREPPPPPRSMPIWRWIAPPLAIALFALAMWWRAEHRGAALVPPSSVDAPNPARVVSPALEGRSIPVQRSWKLPAPYPPYAVPRRNVRANRAMVLEDTPGEPRVVYSYNRPGDKSARILMMDPRTEEVLWDVGFYPSNEEVFTHDGVPPEVLDYSFEGRRLWHAGPIGDLGDVIVMVAMQTYSPTFVVFVSISTGEILGHYVHPGFLESGIVADVDADGRQELVLGGCDNVTDRAVLVALEPGRWTGAASTVRGNASGSEQSRARLLLPRAEEALGASSTPRLAVLLLEEFALDVGSGILTVGASFGEGMDFFHVMVGHDLLPDPDHPITLWDSDEINLTRHGLSPDLVATWREDFVHLSGVARDP